MAGCFIGFHNSWEEGGSQVKNISKSIQILSIRFCGMTVPVNIPGQLQIIAISCSVKVLFYANHLLNRLLVLPLAAARALKDYLAALLDWQLPTSHQNKKLQVGS